jgi:hypothetical protein
MEMVHEFFCWLIDQDEGDAKLVKSSSAREAARKAVDSWKHEGTISMQTSRLTVQVRDPEGEVHQIAIDQGEFLRQAGSAP